MTRKITDRPLMKTGPKPHQPPPGTAEKLREAASAGFTKLGCALRLGTTAEILRRWIDQYPELQEAFDQGREQERHTLHNVLYRQAVEQGNATAAMFLLKTKHGYREGDQSDQANRITINFSLPGALPMAEFVESK